MYCLARAAVVLCAAVPVSLFVPPFAVGQTATSNASSQAQPPSTSTPAAQPTKKVWTNEDMGTLRAESTVSTVGQTAGAKKTVKPTPASTKDNRTSNSYQSQIAKLRAQLPPIDSQIAELQSALSGNVVNEQRQYGGVKLDDWQAQLAQLQKKRDDIQNQIEKLEDDARHNGVPNNALP